VFFFFLNYLLCIARHLSHSLLLLTFLTLTMALRLTARQQEFLARSSATIAAMDQSKVANKELDDDSSKQYKAHKKRQGIR